MLHHRGLRDGECLRLLSEADGLDGCTRLNLSYNRLSLQDAQLSSTVLFRAASLVHLDLSRNRIQCIPRPSLIMSSLVTLDLSHNLLCRLPGDFFESMPNLQSFRAADNALETLPKSLGRLHRLEQLILSQNCLGELSPHSLPPSLIVFECEENRLADLPLHLGNLRVLTRLSLQHNQLTRVPALDLRNMQALESINLQRNQLHQVSEGIAWPPHLRVLDLSSNAIPCLPGDFQLPSQCILLLTGNPCVEREASADSLSSTRRPVGLSMRLVEMAARRLIVSEPPPMRPLTPPVREYLQEERVKICANCPMRFFQPAGKKLLAGNVQGHPETTVEGYVCSLACMNCPRRNAGTLNDPHTPDTTTKEIGRDSIVLLPLDALFDI